MNMSDYKPKHFNWLAQNGVAVITLKGAERKNPITFESYAELGQTFRALSRARDIKVIIFGSNGGNFCSGGDVHDIIGPLLSRDMKGLLEFTRMTGELVKAMRACPQPIIAVIGHGRASELLYTGRVMTAEEGERWGFFNRIVGADKLEADSMAMAQQLANGPTFAHAMTKTMLHQEFAMPLDAAIEAEALAQAVCMQTRDFRRAYEAFVAKQKPQFAGN